MTAVLARQELLEMKKIAINAGRTQERHFHYPAVLAERENARFFINQLQLVFFQPSASERYL
ncbi:hypothetical protein COV61_03540 [Candidatus Micrarchaeota archaeon CG11_big_fil_rev_8_21_14_0_20_47_5]|nr:MAG: hypothetical protein AUJ17_05675 [Candidatus Micrarchaeota archaeon CG1_02_47_40]PIN83283.1 MAG: hypothetical protein COV61_03540 [Candidatus Micrarchaeota archaeon CG11_big_fil_rev_8_21_14_0_20_47_5]